MRDRMLHDSLRALTDDASSVLEDLLASGAEIPFEVGDSGRDSDAPGMRGSVTMFAYRPLTSEFVSTHADRLRSLVTFENAAQNLARTRGVVAYLRARNEPVLDVGELTHARLAALAFLSAVWQDAERFEHWGDRFERAYAELESIALAERLVTTVFVPVHGVALSEGSINLGGGVELIAREELDAVCADRFADAAIDADSFCSVSITAPSDAPTPMPAVRLAARTLLSGLRLFRPGSIALGMTAQAEIAGAWHQVSVPFSGRSHEAAWILRPEDEEELRQFVNAVRRVERRTRISWALKRFETGLERTVPADGLTDFLLALRALLEADDDNGRAALPARLSALCAQDHERSMVRDEIVAAFALERLAIDGHVGRADRKRLEMFAPLEVIAATERHLRALLHDLVCGYLATDLKTLADEILTADGEQPGSEIEPAGAVHLEPVPDPGTPEPEDPVQVAEFESVFDDTAEIRAIDMREDLAALNEPAAETVEPAEAKVWKLRPAAEIAPAPEVSVEPLDSNVDEVADEGPLAPPAWDAAPERRPVAERVTAPQSTEPSGFTFDFQPVEARPSEPDPLPVEDISRPAASEPAAGAVDFPIPEFGVPSGRGPAITRSDAQIGAEQQEMSLSQIMDQSAVYPDRPSDETSSTPIVRDARSHLSAVESVAPEPQEPRIVPPAGSEPALLPLDPQLTVEYDVLGAENSAEEAAQLAWSQQFVNREQPSEVDQPSADFGPPEPASDVAARPEPPRLLPVEPASDVVVARFPEPIREVEHHEHASEGDRNHRVGPATVEFRPVVDADPDDPDDFSGAC